MSIVGLVASLAAAATLPDPAALKAACPGEPLGGWQASGQMLAEYVWRERQRSQAVCLYLGAVLMEDIAPQKALRLHLLGMIRSQYEHGLCREWPHNEVSSFYAALRGTSGSALSAREHTPQVAKAALREVAEGPDVLSYEPAMLEELCGGAEGIRPRAEWPGVAEKLLEEVRASAEGG